MPRWTIDDKEQPYSLFQMIKHTHQHTPQYTLSAYADNAAVIEGHPTTRYRPDPITGEYRHEAVLPGAFQIKVETHNHPTAIAPFPVPPQVPEARSVMKGPLVAAANQKPD